MAIKVHVQRFGIGVIPHEQFEHANDFCAFLVDRRRVEVVDFLKTFGPHGVGQGALVLGELTAAQFDHIGNPFHRSRAHVRCELAVTVNGQTLFQTQLEPVAAGDAVACPVVEILMRDDRLDPFEVRIGACFWRGQNAGRVEDVQALVFHRAHVEVIDGHDVEDIQIVFATVDLFIPTHRRFQRLHAKGTFVFVAGAHPDVQFHVLAGLRDETIGVVDQITGHQCEQIGGLGPRIVPFGPAFALRHWVAVGQQHRQIAFDPHGKDAHDIGAVGVIGNLAEALCLALGAVHAVRHI